MPVPPRDRTTLDPVSIESLGGYRLVRKLGEAPRAEVFLAHPQRDDSDAVPAAIKLTRAGVSDDSVLLEASALSRAAGAHVVELLDAAPGPDGIPVLVLQRLPGGSLARLLRDRPRLSRGEAITVLAPVVGAVSRLHDAGVAHGGIRAEAVLFDAAGAPVLACFGGATLFEPGLPPARREREPALVADTRAAAALTSQVLVGVEGGHDLAEWIESSVELSADDWLEQLAARLFALGEAEPVAFGQEHVTPADAVPARLISGEPVGPPPEPAPALPAWLDGLVPPAIADAVTLSVSRVRTVLATVRRPVWIAAGGVAVALLAAIMIVPPGDSDAAPAPSGAPHVTSAAPVDPGPVLGDDPVLALLALVETRERCIRDLSVLCLDDVAQADSAALTADQQLVRALQDGAEVEPAFTVTAEQVTLVERLGDSAILDLADAGERAPASVLLMKGEAGWRIRDYLD
jgi:hypothetical protein